MEAKEVKSKFKNSYYIDPQLFITLPSTSLTETIVSVHVRSVYDCQIDCVIVNPKESVINFVLSIVSTAVVQDAQIFTVKPRYPLYE